jgi:hypothetical protein
MMGILSKNSKKEYPKSVTELLRLEKKMCKASVTSYKKEKEMYKLLRVKTYIKKSRGARYDRTRCL